MTLSFLQYIYTYELRGGTSISKVDRPLQINVHGGGGGYNRQCAKKQTNLAEKTCTLLCSFQTVVSETGKTGAGGESPQ